MSDALRPGRNDPCPCGSGRKFKKCCGPFAAGTTPTLLGASQGSDATASLMATREVSPVTGLTAARYYQTLSGGLRAVVDRIRTEKRAGARRRPSTHLITEGDAPGLDRRAALLDRVAALVDENLSGRSDMCVQAAELLARALQAMGQRAEARKGMAAYRGRDDRWFEWQHAWVMIDDDVLVDGNCDSMVENPMVPEGIRPTAFWGPVEAIPQDRRFDLKQSRPLAPHEQKDEDVRMWWIDLNAWLKEEGLTLD